MKILHITTMSTGGAFIAAKRLSDELIKHGEESKILVLDTSALFKDTIPFCKHTFLKTLLFHILKSFLYRFKIGIGKYWRLHDSARNLGGNCLYSYPISLFRVEKHQLVRKWADIIHLHWCDNFINYTSFFPSVKKPIIWTMHDVSIQYGGFHFDNDYFRLCDYYHDIETLFIQIKRDALEDKKNIRIITPCQEMQRRLESVPYLKNMDIMVLPNIVDFEKFNIKRKNESRNRLKLPEKKILLFVSEYVETESKGLNDLRTAIKQIKEFDILLCIIGNYDIQKAKQDEIDSIYIGKIIEPELLSLYYSAADLLVVPSYQESFAQTPFEAMACGTPIVAYPCGAIPEYTNVKNGIVCKNKDIAELRDSIVLALQHKYEPSEIRESILQKLSPDEVIIKYIDLYKDFKMCFE